jgi:signal transduction histidine kinase
MFPAPFNDTERLNTLASYDVLDTPPEQTFDCLTRLACTQFDAPIAVVSLVDQARQWFKSSQGLNVTETPREVAFCAHAILRDEPLIVLDATRDERFCTNPLVCGDPGIRFYAGAPLTTRQGFRLGTFCVIDLTARQDFAGDEIVALKDFALAAMQALELRKRVMLTEATSQEDRIAEDARTELFSMVAHEIKSPIAALYKMAQTMGSRIFGPMGDPRYEEFSILISELAEQAMGTTDRMLSFARIRTGDVELNDEQISVRDLLGRINRLLTPTIENGHASVRIAPIDDDFVLMADRTYVVQMLTNLITNAVKYSETDPRVEIATKVSDTGALEIAVIDSGIGMSPDGISQALIPYVRLKRTGRTEVGGVGIGLPLVKRLIELHGGQLVIDSIEGVGTKASILFPPYRVVTTNERAKLAV